MDPSRAVFSTFDMDRLWEFHLLYRKERLKIISKTAKFGSDMLKVISLKYTKIKLALQSCEIYRRWYDWSQVCAPHHTNICKIPWILYLLIFEQNNFKLCYFTNLKVLFPAEFTEFLVHLSMSKVEQKKAWKDQFVQSKYFSVEGWNFYSVTIPSLEGPFFCRGEDWFVWIIFSIIDHEAGIVKPRSCLICT